VFRLGSTPSAPISHIDLLVFCLISSLSFLGRLPRFLSRSLSLSLEFALECDPLFLDFKFDLLEDFDKPAVVVVDELEIFFFNFFFFRGVFFLIFFCFHGPFFLFFLSSVVVPLQCNRKRTLVSICKDQILRQDNWIRFQ